MAELRTEDGKLYVFVAIDRASKFAFVEPLARATRRKASEFPRRLIKAMADKARTILTDNRVQLCHTPQHRDGPIESHTLRDHLLRCLLRSLPISDRRTTVMNFRQYEALYWIGRLGSFHAAARHLKTSQPAISARIRDLEQSLGVILFERADRGVRLTLKGRDLLQYAAQLVALAAEIQQKVGAQQALSGRVRLGVTNIHALTWLPRLIERISQSHPGVLVEVAIDTSETMQALMERGQLDVAVLAGPIESANLVTEPVGRVANVWVASPSMNLPHEVLSARDLASHPIISDRPGTRLHTATMEWFRSEGVEPQRHHSCSLLPTRIHLAVQGIGAALAARSAIDRELAQGYLEILTTQRRPPDLSYLIAYSDIGLSPCGQVVIEATRSLIAQKPDLESYYTAAQEIQRQSDGNLEVPSSNPNAE